MQRLGRIVMFFLIALAAGIAGIAAPLQTQAAQPHVLQSVGASTSGSGSWFVTTYEQSGPNNIEWVTCGHDPSSSGCYGSGVLGPFGRPCAVAGSGARVYVLDSLGAGGSPMLYVYKQVESSTPSATLLKTVRLSPTLGATSTGTCSLAVLGTWLYAGHSESDSYVQVDLADYTVRGGPICGGPTTAITASEQAVVVSMSNCFALFDKSGNEFEDGGEVTNTFVPGGNGHQLP